MGYRVTVLNLRPMGHGVDYLAPHFQPTRSRACAANFPTKALAKQYAGAYVRQNPDHRVRVDQWNTDY